MPDAPHSQHNDEWIDTANTPERSILDLRRIGMRHALALGRFRYVHASAPLEEQRHDRWLILQFVLSGKQVLVVDGQETTVRGGEMIRLLPGQRYGTGVWPEQRGEMAWLILKFTPLPAGPALGMSAEGIKAIRAVLTNSSAPIVCPMPRDVPELLESAFDWWSSRDDDVGREMVRNRISTLVLGVASVLSGRIAMASDRANEFRIKKVLRWMEDHPLAEADSQELARMAGLSVARFHVHFKRLTGSSPKDYWLRSRIEQAAKHLRQCPGIPVTELALDFGFSSSQYFATVFRRYMGFSPSVHRSRKAS